MKTTLPYLNITRASSRNTKDVTTINISTNKYEEQILAQLTSENEKYTKNVRRKNL